MWRLALTAVGIIAIGATVAAQRTGNAFATAGAIAGWIAVGACAVSAERTIRRAKSLAAAHLSAALGFRVRRACFSRPEGWRAFIDRERRYQEQGHCPRCALGCSNDTERVGPPRLLKGGG